MHPRTASCSGAWFNISRTSASTGTSTRPCRRFCQKFRVAVSVALAVGRFASGRAQPLEAVVIDEGFGGLDKDGLRAMADALKRLQRSQSLKRVILVSHQEEFTDQFPVGYRLSPAETGTAAAPFRR